MNTVCFPKLLILPL